MAAVTKCRNFIKLQQQKKEKEKKEGISFFFHSHERFF
jgi:hypothetical protein